MATLPAWSKADSAPSAGQLFARIEAQGQGRDRGPKTSPTMAIRLLAITTGQKVGHTKMTAARCASTASARTTTPRLARVSSIARADRGLDGEPEQAAERGHQADFGLAPMLLGDQEHIEIRPERAADVGQQEVDGVERERVETLCRWLISQP